MSNKKFCSKGVVSSKEQKRFLILKIVIWVLSLFFVFKYCIFN